MHILNLPTLEQARAVKTALDTYMRLAIGQIDTITELVRSGVIPVGGQRGERVVANLDQIDQVDKLVNKIKVTLGYTPNGSNGISNGHVDPSGHRAYEVMRVLAREIAMEQNPNPTFKGVDYDGLVVRYTDDPAPSAHIGAGETGAAKAFNDAINFALDKAEFEGMAFLALWREGDWDSIKKEFPRFDLSSSMAPQVAAAAQTQKEAETQ